MELKLGFISAGITCDSQQAEIGVIFQLQWYLAQQSQELYALSMCEGTGLLSSNIVSHTNCSFFKS